MRLHDRALAWFTDWFGSGSGVWQTTIVVLAITGFECFNRALDPHAFILMAALTVYSAITQPALAHAGDKNHALLCEVLDELRKMMADEYVVDTKTYDLVARIARAAGVAIEP